MKEKYSNRAVLAIFDSYTSFQVSIFSFLLPEFVDAEFRMLHLIRLWDERKRDWVLLYGVFRARLSWRRHFFFLYAFLSSLYGWHDEGAGRFLCRTGVPERERQFKKLNCTPHVHTFYTARELNEWNKSRLKVMDEWNMHAIRAEIAWTPCTKSIRKNI